MRVFVALKLPKKVKKEIFSAFRKFHAKYRFKWVPEENYHITLVFLGEVSKAYLHGKLYNLQKVLEDFGEFELAIKGWGKFPVHGKIMRVLWVGLDYPKELLDMQRKIAEIFQVDERRPYVPHITVARSGRDNFFNENVDISKLSFVCSEVCVYESKLSPQGATYKELFCFKLRTR